MNPPRPGTALIACSLAAIALSTVLCALCAASMLHPWGIRGLSSLLLLPGFLGLGLTQYAGTFQAKVGSAETVARLYSFGGGFMVIALVCLLLDGVRANQVPGWPVIALGVVFVLFALWGRTGGRLNRTWADALRRHENEHEDETYSAARRGHPVVWVVTLALFLTATGFFYLAMGPKSGEHRAPAATPLALPEEASDVCYWIYAGNTVFEFSVSEQGFLTWAEKEIDGRRQDFDGFDPVEAPVSIPTYRAWLPDAPSPHEATIETGHYYGWQEQGREVQFAYDSEAGRGYYCSTSR